MTTDVHVHFTIGPASWPEPVLHDLIATGPVACRVNLSHTQPGELAGQVARLRAAAAEVGRKLLIGADIRGRKVRIGPLPGGSLELAADARFDLVPVPTDAEEPGGEDHASVNCPTLGQAVRPGDLLLLRDGALRLRVDALAERRVRCYVEVGGTLTERCGFAAPGRRLLMPPLTGKDEADLDALVAAQPDFVYLSYVETAEDIALLRGSLEHRGLTLPVTAKIERAVALAHLDEIAAAADALCLARGDLGVELALPKLPAAQRQVVSAAHAAKKPVLLAGEVLYTMVSRPVPSRAELTDVVVALEQGCAGFVLSDETAVGCDPAGAVRWLLRIAEAQGVAI